MRTNILIISLYYPPIRSVASNRVVSFAKYLDKTRFKVHVLTVSAPPGSAPQTLEGVHVHRLPDVGMLRTAHFTGRQGRFVHALKAAYNRILTLCVLDLHADWRSRAVRKAEELIRNEGIDVVVSSYSPLAAHLAAQSLKKAHPGIVWIADMRDEMSRNPFQPLLTRRRLARPERLILHAADAVTTVSRPLLEDFTRLANRPGLVLREVRNGFDFELPSGSPPQGERFVIAYTGSFYGRYTPYPFFLALERFFEREHAPEVHVRIVGALKPVDLSAALRSRVTFEEAVPHDQALAIMRSSDLLLLYHPKTDRKGYYSGKLFEYLASLRPVLAVVDPDSVAADLVREARAGYVADSSDIAAITETIARAYHDWKERKAFDPDRSVIGRHHRREQVRILEDLVQDLCVRRASCGAVAAVRQGGAS